MTSNSKIALVALAVMAGVAGTALVFALSTKDFRNKVTLKKKGKIADHLPAKLPALAYASRNANMVFGVHVASLMSTSSGRALIENDSQGVGWLLHQIEQATGVTPKGMDHVVGCRDALHWLLILRTRSPYDAGAVGQNVRTKTVQYRGKPAYRLRLMQRGSAWLWLADDTTLLLLAPCDGGKLPDLDRFSHAGLSDQMKALLEKRIDKRARMWLIGDSSAAKTKLPLKLAILGEMQIKKIAMSAIFTNNVTFIGGVQGQDSNETKEIAKFLVIAKKDKLKIVPPPRNIQDDEQNWVLWQFRGNANGFWAIVRNLLVADWE